ncbi:MAG: uroporphyrinogen decarboxylase family protein [Lentisphaeria bacterium]|nr:uroporphyrinogen decarboxylase family protein [Lentisphaeria bacterium]
MTGKERIQKAFALEPVDRTPWVPFVGVHGGHLIGVDAGAYLKDADSIVAGVLKAAELYKADGVPVVFDLQVEAEVLGCELTWSKDSPPAVSSHPLSMLSGGSLADLTIPGKDAGRIPVCLEATRRLRAELPDLAIYGLITGPFTLALHLLGTDIFMQMFDAPDEIHTVLAFCADVCKAMSDYYLEAGCDVIALVDPMTSQIGPDQFTEFVTPAVTPVFDHIRGRGGLSSFFVCGHAEQNLQVMCESGPDNVSVDENISLKTIKEICLENNTSFGGNLQLTTVLLLGSPVDAQTNAIECLETGGDKGFILAPGCDLPFSVPQANLAAIADVLDDEYAREVVKAQKTVKSAEELLDMTDYGNTDTVVVDIITLDSEACAPCQYMVESVRKIAPEFEGVVEWREHKIKQPESILFMSSLMVRNIPTICIDGQIAFVSRIPPRDELIAAIQKRIIEKLRVKIANTRGEVYLLCSEKACDTGACEELARNVSRAASELGIEIPVKKITDDETIASFGLLPSQTPALATAKYQVRSTRTVPGASVIREWLKDIQ